MRQAPSKLTANTSPQDYAEPNKPKPEVIHCAMPFIEHSRNRTIIEMENRLAVARVRVRVGVGSGFGREEQRRGDSVEWNVLDIHGVTIGVLVGVMCCGFVECHGLTGPGEGHLSLR